MKAWKRHFLLFFTVYFQLQTFCILLTYFDQFSFENCPTIIPYHLCECVCDALRKKSNPFFVISKLLCEKNWKIHRIRDLGSRIRGFLHNKLLCAVSFLIKFPEFNQFKFRLSVNQPSWLATTSSSGPSPFEKSPGLPDTTESTQRYKNQN